MIGLNWLFLSYASCSVVDSYNVPKVLQFLLPPILMLIYDCVLEHVAPKMDMWSWKDGVVPIQNFIVWFILASIFTAFIRLFKINTKNPLSKVILFSQFVFLSILMLIL